MVLLNVGFKGIHKVLHVCLYTTSMQCPQRQEEGVGFHKAGGHCELPGVDRHGDETEVLYAIILMAYNLVPFTTELTPPNPSLPFTF